VKLPPVIHRVLFDSFYFRLINASTVGKGGHLWPVRDSPAGIMVKGVGFLVLVGLISTGCAATGLYAGSGPCRGWKADLTACERAAAENAALAANVRIGQTAEEVRGVMKTHPDRRTGTATSEVWMWLTDYARQQMTAFVFVDGKVSEIKTVR
jgi:hypothetical protein